jgi:hypothetical protein
MAENKKSFLLYADLIHTVKKMPKEKAGELFLTILSYVNDENPVIDDMLIDLVFEPIKRQMKRDLVKYEEKINKCSEAGKLSAAKKALQRSIEDEQNSTKSTDVEVSSTKSTVTVNDTVTVTVTDTKKKKEIRYAFDSDIFKNKYNDWLEFRKQKRKPLAAQSIEQQMAFLKRYGEDVAIQIIDKSIMNGWQGLFAPKEGEAEPVRNRPGLTIDRAINNW